MVFEGEEVATVVGTHAGRVNRPSPWPWLVPVAALVAGTLFASSVRASQGEDLRTDQAQLPDLIRAQNRTNEARASDLDDLQGQVDQATAGLAPGDLQTQKLERQANEIAATAGRTAVRGPALRVTLDDAKLAGGEVPAGADPDDYVIHQRVVSTSAVRCVGNTLILQGRVYSPPYVITAIGDRDAMRRSLDTDPAVANLRDWSIAVGLGYDVSNVGRQT